LLEKLADKLGVGQQVIFAGYLSNAAEQIYKHSACLHVAFMESFGIVLIEALSRSVPVFAPAVGGVPEVFNDGVEGRFIPLDDVEAALRIITQWLDSPQLLKQAQRAARSRFLECFEAENVAADLTDFLTQT
jgi:glycosyltransferase involved in cell wall biosynthesis